MILYIKSVGFSEYNTKEKAESLVASIIKDPDTKTTVGKGGGEVNVEYYRAFGKNFGLLVRGTVGENEELLIHSLVPYAEGRWLTDIHELEVDIDEVSDNYIGYCEEVRSGTPISFFLQNVIEYLDVEDEMTEADKDEIYVDGIRLTAFCIEGTVILPIDKDEEDILAEEEEDALREMLLDKARSGDENALNILEEEALEASDALKERLQKEDILSILEGFFVPVGESSDIFSVLGSIEEIEYLENVQTEETVYLIKVKCMNIFIDVYVNEKDLVGHPTAGMRFKGTCWLHGKIDFSAVEEEELDNGEDMD